LKQKFQTGKTKEEEKIEAKAYPEAVTIEI